MIPNSNIPTHLTSRDQVKLLAGSEIRKVANQAMGRSDILAFWFGESDRPTPQFIRDAAMASLDKGETFYSQNLGRPYLREAISNYLSNLHDKPISPNRIGVAGSGVAAIMLAAQLIVDPRSRIVAVTPLWPNLVEIPKILGAEVERVPLDVKDGRWSLDLDKLLSALTPDTRMLMLNSPNNPTGWVIDQPSVDVILAHCRKHGIWILSDDVYERLIFDPSQRSAPSFLKTAEPEDRIISVNSCSKAWTMTGWRAGWLVVPADLEDDLAKVIEYNGSCLFEPIQRGAYAAITEGESEISALRARLLETRNVLINGLRELPGVEVPEAGGAMYVFFRIEGYEDTTKLASQLVNEVGLGLAPGYAFGPEGSGWLRWCHAFDVERLQLGLGKLRQFLLQSK
ncbi:pyridoxal phosphate-dependent aminotransferase [Pseudomonas baetica]|uniref:pyridoxal phosphate-dependent aminotransferase n=1 Tax=Pseudomonas baetica TaxID=674054 RepID=UPI003EE8A6A0